MKEHDLARPMSVVLRPVPQNHRGSFGLTVCLNQRPPTGLVTISCGPRGGFAIAEAIESELKRRGLPVRFATIKCLGLCEDGPNVRLTPSNSWFHGVHPADVPEIIATVERQLQAAGVEARAPDA